jgi:DNA-binding transcriptional LysR family regulator
VSPPRLLAGRGEEPVELHALVAAGRGVTVAHELTVSVARADVAVRPLAGVTGGGRTIQAAAPHGHRAPAARAVLEALREVGRRHADRLTAAG